MEKVILTYGTFDLFHVGHVRLLKRLSELGDKLIVGVSSDSFNAIKGKKTIIPYEQRVEVLEALSCVDLVIPELSWEQKISDIQKYNVDTFAMGDDWKGKFDELKVYCEVCYLPRTESVSSTEIKTALEKTLSLTKNELRAHFEIINQLLEDLK